MVTSNSKSQQTIDDSNDNIESTLNDLRVRVIDLNSPISSSRRQQTIEEIRAKIVENSKRKILIGRYGDAVRVALLRGPFKVAVLEVENGQGVSEAEIRSGIEAKILAGEYDDQLISVYEQFRKRDRERRKVNGTR